MNGPKSGQVNTRPRVLQEALGAFSARGLLPIEPMDPAEDVDLRDGSTTRQYGPVGETALMAGAIPWRVRPGLATTPSSGNFARIVQLSVSRRPVLMPPCTVSPFRNRALEPTSTPCQFSICFAKLLACCAS